MAEMIDRLEAAIKKTHSQYQADLESLRAALREAEAQRDELRIELSNQVADKISEHERADAERGRVVALEALLDEGWRFPSMAVLGPRFDNWKRRVLEALRPRALAGEPRQHRHEWVRYADAPESFKAAFCLSCRTIRDSLNDAHWVAEPEREGAE